VHDGLALRHLAAGAFGVDMDPVVVAGERGEGVDPGWSRLIQSLVPSGWPR
jgi:hypothetical protein